MIKLTLSNEEIYQAEIMGREIIKKLKTGKPWYSFSKNQKIFEKLVKSIQEERRELEDIYIKKDKNGKIQTTKKPGVNGVEVDVPVWTDEAAYTEDLNALFARTQEIELWTIADMSYFESVDDDRFREALHFFMDKVIFPDAVEPKPSAKPAPRKKR